MAFKEVRRRSNLFRPWDSAISTTANQTQSSNISQSSPQTLTKTTSTPVSHVKRSSLKSNNTKSLEHVNCSSMRASTLSDSNINSMPCPTVPTLPAQWQPNLLSSSNHLPMMPRPDLMLVHPHSAIPFADHMFYEHLNQQSLINASSLADPSLMNTPNITRQWRQLHQQKKQRPKRFQCPHCRVSFSNNGQLKGHIRIHTGINTRLVK